MASDSSSDSEDLYYGTHISDDDDGPVKSRAEQRLRQNDPHRQAKFQHLHEQQVHDAQGRRRFHGAFTGGFSAGYYNTAGSEEGWAPSEWRSSRGDRSQRPAQRPEDFMDEEDLAEQRGSQALVTQAGFSRAAAGRSAAAAEPAVAEASEQLGEALAGLLVPARPHEESIGFQMLRQMGWRDGFGVGARERRVPRRRKPVGAQPPSRDGRKVYGCARGPEPSSGGDGDEDEDDEDGNVGAAACVGFAPRATEAVTTRPKCAPSRPLPDCSSPPHTPVPPPAPAATRLQPPRPRARLRRWDAHKRHGVPA